MEKNEFFRAGIHRNAVKARLREQAKEIHAGRLPGGLLGALHAARETWEDRRQRRCFLDPLTVPAASRLPAMLLALLTKEIERRGGETSIEGDRASVHLEIVDRLKTPTGIVYLLRAEGWRQYSRSFGTRRATLCYLAGTDDGGRWAARVPGTKRSAAEALDWIEPAAVKRAREGGRRVIRQGDVYAVETTAKRDGRGADDLPEDHGWDESARALIHRSHTRKTIDFPVEFHSQSVLKMGRFNGRQRGD